MNNLPKLTGKDVIAIAIILTMGVISLSYIVITKEGEFDFCFQESSCLKIKKGQNNY